jgi:hypothetical protein
LWIKKSAESWNTFGLHVECRIGEFVGCSRIGWFGNSNGTNACPTFLLLKVDEGCHIIAEQVVKGPGAVEFRQKQPNAVHEGRDLWLKALKDLSESEARP